VQRPRRRQQPVHRDRTLPTRNDPRGMLLAGFTIGWASAGCLVLLAMRLT
jgi:hypothetical protein